MGKKLWIPILVAVAAIIAVTMFASSSDDDTTSSEVSNESETDVSTLAILGTTDIHAHVLPYDYMNDEEDDSIGLSKVYSVIEEKRSEYDHNILIDNGDTIQGSILGDMPAQIEGLEEDETHVIMDVMNEIDYDAAAIGNHEFNFGLDFLNQTINDADFPWLSANVVEPGTEDPVYEPYTLMEKEIDGEELTIGMIGFVPPQIMQWDYAHLDGEVETMEIVEAAEKHVPEMKEEGADIVVAISHTGIDDGDHPSENAAIPLSEVDDIDAMLLGHQHSEFPSDEDYNGMEGVDPDEGTINDVPTVMPGSWGSHLGVITLDLQYDDEEWTVETANAEIFSTADAESHDDVEEIAREVHEDTIEYVNTPVGETASSMHTYFSRVVDNEVVQLINDAQLDYIESLQEDGELEEEVPLLSAAAPFRAGRGGDFTYVDEGSIAISDMNDIYVYPNTLHVIEVNGEQLKNWLEYSTANFHRIDPDSDEEQDLVNLDFSSYNFDVIENVNYEIDVTKEEGERIQNLSYDGEDVGTDDRFFVATNNYRAGGGGGHLDEDIETVLETTEENRQLVIDYVIDHDGPLDIEPSNNWELSPIEAEGEVLFESASEAKEYTQEYENIEFVEEGDGNEAVFTIE
ncbi:2',3'-cyclic-nucleotide 2'-phosphodiesterase [Geomicrobium halophilum]|uniref:2',3'-cyclic-nucleotide 2'-phosphodiesterase n=1 Tax=Geomicrobium halophilum TaxID=549000 RepID=A0A841Q0H6_9BACL|nr:bifunctional 2',3'-cyclic-nucleotide 2'-phosphodiesterase/3'-nucleotidase [Geomicrobium halophilum]MBB6451193.1 2',3'-cyclic-nucleotide 2'-phosphodiesterase [Geomicrobium halophilum]